MNCEAIACEPWSWIWQAWASAAYVRAYLDAVKVPPFVPSRVETTALLLDTVLLEKAFADLRHDLRRRPEMAWIPMQAILRQLNVHTG